LLLLLIAGVVTAAELTTRVRVVVEVFVAQSTRHSTLHLAAKRHCRRRLCCYSQTPHHRLYNFNILIGKVMQQKALRIQGTRRQIATNKNYDMDEFRSNTQLFTIQLWFTMYTSVRRKTNRLGFESQEVKVNVKVATSSKMCITLKSHISSTAVMILTK